MRTPHIVATIVPAAVLAGAAGPALAAGLPQLDASRFPPQVVWLAISFIALYLVMWRVALPRVGQVLEDRQRRIAGNLKKAESLKADAEAAAAGYEKAMAEARAAGQDVLRQARETIAAEVAARHAALGERLNAEVAGAEARIAAAKTDAIAGVREIATDVATQVVGRLAGDDIDPAAIAQAVERTVKERA